MLVEPVAFAPVESVTWTVKLYLPAVVLLPVTTPCGETVRPGGIPVPAHVYGGVPPEA